MKKFDYAQQHPGYIRKVLRECERWRPNNFYTEYNNTLCSIQLITKIESSSV